MSSLIRPRRIVGASVAAGLLGAGLIALPATAADSAWDTDAFRGRVQVVPAAEADPTPDVLEGAVFEDLDRDSVQDANEPGVAGVAVTNGRDVVTTDAEGAYALPAEDGMTFAVTQPAGYRVPVDADNLPQMHYHHLVEGSTELAFGGLHPTGALPAAVNFPLTRDGGTAGPEQSLALASDIQTKTVEEIGYARTGAIADLAARDDYSSAGVLMTGDIAYDDLSLYPQIRELTAMMNGPAWPMPGNHDMDLDATVRERAFDSYKQALGPDHYSFDTGDVHVVVLNDIEYPKPDGTKGYRYSLDADQMAWLEADLARVPDDTAVVVASHAPLLEFYYQDKHRVDDLQRIYGMLDRFENVVSVSGHTHMAENLRAGDLLAGWQDVTGAEGLPFAHLVLPTVSGQWYDGRLTEAGYPTAVQRDGTPPGIVTLDFTGTDHRERFAATGRDEAEQMSVGLNTPVYRAWWEANRKNRGAAPAFDAHTVAQDALGETWLSTNFWMGGTGDVVEVSVDGRDPVTAERTQTLAGDTPNIGAEFTDPSAAYEQLVHGGGLHDRSSHIWRAPLPADLTPGVHTAVVTATDVHGRVFTTSYEFQVAGEDGTVPGGTGGAGDVPVTAQIPGTDGSDDGDGDGSTGPGSLVLSVADGGLELGDARHAGDHLRLTGSLPQVSVTDSRSESAGWTVTGSSSDLTSGTATLRAGNLDWQPYLVDGDATPGAATGLAAPATLGTSAGGIGTDTLAADVRLQAPVDTTPGTYTGAMTVSLFPQD